MMSQLARIQRQAQLQQIMNVVCTRTADMAADILSQEDGDRVEAAETIADAMVQVAAGLRETVKEKNPS